LVSIRLDTQEDLFEGRDGLDSGPVPLQLARDRRHAGWNRASKIESIETHLLVKEAHLTSLGHETNCSAMCMIGASNGFD
jgi:hypothetical protein